MERRESPFGHKGCRITEGTGFEAYRLSKAMAMPSEDRSCPSNCANYLQRDKTVHILVDW
jgi:hypothetical protein